MAIITPTYAGDKSLNSKFVDYTQTNTNAVEKIIGIIENNMITYLDDCLSIYKNEGGDIVRPDKLKMVAAHLTEQAYLHNVSDVDGNQDKVKKMTHDDYSEEFFSPSELSRS